MNGLSAVLLMLAVLQQGPAPSENPAAIALALESGQPTAIVLARRQPAAVEDGHEWVIWRQTIGEDGLGEATAAAEVPVPDHDSDDKWTAAALRWDVGTLWMVGVRTELDPAGGRLPIPQLALQSLAPAAAPLGVMQPSEAFGPGGPAAALGEVAPGLQRQPVYARDPSLVVHADAVLVAASLPDFAMPPSCPGVKRDWVRIYRVDPTTGGVTEASHVPASGRCKLDRTDAGVYLTVAGLGDDPSRLFALRADNEWAELAMPDAAHCEGPASVVGATDGALVLVAVVGGEDDALFVRAWTSRDSGETWSEPITLGQIGGPSLDLSALEHDRVLYVGLIVGSTSESDGTERDVVVLTGPAPEAD